MKKDARAVMDASALLAMIQQEAGADSLRPLLPRAVVSTVNAAEVLGKLIREGMPRPAAIETFAALHIEEVSFDCADAERSAAYAAKGVSLGDRCFLAAAARYGEGFTSDGALQRLSGAPRLHCFR